MLFKLSLGNIRRSLRDYAIYFFTLIIGVAVFYVFNSIGSQAAYMTVTEDTRELIKIITIVIDSLSFTVALILGFLIVYASRFLMKRRHKEFALYLTLGMSKGRISALLLFETIFIGIGSLFVGLLIGIGLSQLMSVFVANLFEADMSAFRFTVSGSAITKTILYFGVMYIVVMILNTFIIGKCKLIDLMQSGKRSEKMKLRSPLLCTVIFVISALLLGNAYYLVSSGTDHLTRNKLIGAIVIGCICTYFIFWSVTGLILRIAMSVKGRYYRGLNSFTFRQLSSKVNTMVMSMSVICIMLFVTICLLSSAFSVRNSLNSNINELCPADIEIIDNRPYKESEDIVEAYSKEGLDITKDISDYVHFHYYNAPDLSYKDFFGDKLNSLKDSYTSNIAEFPETIIRVSDYNALMKLYNRDEHYELADDEYFIAANVRAYVDLRNEVLENNKEITVFGKKLTSKYDSCVDGSFELSITLSNFGFFVVPDDVVDENWANDDYFIGKYSAKDKKGREAIEKYKRDEYEKAFGERYTTAINDKSTDNYVMLVTKQELASSTVGLGALATFVALYLGLTFLISCGAILALKELSEDADSVSRYDMLRKIGVEESEISKSLFIQTGAFFLLPLLLAVIHSFFGMKFAVYLLEIFVNSGLLESVLTTSAITVLIYGGYFLITYICGKNIIKDRN